ncbi:protein kinase domain-containing protein [Rubritalea marina]|uniref:protein kinase domain-containing protein n=1 Tax=Rubritalea marina TaxID=361055 RepID=UPI00035E4E83|nr:protein kinase [Rubritalea marina]
MLNRYEIRQELGQGGFGKVYLAYDNKLRREVALKRLEHGLCRDALRKKLLEEAQVLAALKHPNIVSIYDVAEHHDHAEIVMEYIQGITMEDFVKRHLLQPIDFRHIATQILHGVSASHKAGVLHCDIKPENVMLSLTANDQYELKVFDFGISESVADMENGEKVALVGSIHVMAPELFSGQGSTVKTDIYALGCLFYYLLTGVYPYIGDSTSATMQAHLSGKHHPILSLRQDIGKELANWIESLIETNPAKRLSDCSDALKQIAAMQFPDKVEVFTLPTTLPIKTENSTVVRSLTRRSLAHVEASQSKRGTRFLTNTITKNLGMSSKVMQIIDLHADDEDFGDKPKELPEKAEWFFTVDKEAKGPVTLDQLYRLVEEDKVEAKSMVWHPNYGEWVHAISCAELKPYFKHEDLDEGGHDRARSFASEPKKISEAWRDPGVIVTMLGFIALMLLMFMRPELREYGLYGYALILTLMGFMRLRINQFHQGMGWLIGGICVPVLVDVAYVVRTRDIAAGVAVAMLFSGALLLYMLQFLVR